MFTVKRLVLPLLALCAGWLPVGRAEDPKIAPLDLKAVAAAATTPDLKGGIVFPAGAFDLSSTPSAMVLGDLKFPTGSSSSPIN